MSIEENKAIVRRLYEEYYGRRDDTVLDELIAPDYVLRAAGNGWTTSSLRGPAVYRDFMKVWYEACPDFSGTVEQMIAEGDRVVTVIAWSGTHLGTLAYGPAGPIERTGRPLNLPGIVVSRISGGQIVEEWESANNGSVWQQLGAVTSPG